MSRILNNLSLSYSEIPLKSFVRESNEPILQNSKKQTFKLDFDGEEAKLAYEKIISQESKKEPAPVALKSKKTRSKPSVAKNIDEKVTNVNVLFKAVESGDIEFVKKQFDSHNINITDQFGWTPLMSAAYSGHIDIVNIFLKLGADVNVWEKSGLTAIDLASKRHHVDIVMLLRENLRRRNRRSQTPSKSSQNEKITMQLSSTFYCDVCKMNFTETTQKKHETSTLHIFNCKPKISNAHYMIGKHNKGYQMLLNKGWNEEGGLGPDGEGQKYPVKTILKRDREGLGQPNKKTPRVTHFEPRDLNAIRSVHKSRRTSFKKKDRKKQIDKDAAKNRALRQALA